MSCVVSLGMPLLLLSLLTLVLCFPGLLPSLHRLLPIAGVHALLCLLGPMVLSEKLRFFLRLLWLNDSSFLHGRFLLESVLEQREQLLRLCLQRLGALLQHTLKLVHQHAVGVIQLPVRDQRG